MTHLSWVWDIPRILRSKLSKFNFSNQSRSIHLQKERIQALHAPDVMSNTKFGEWQTEERDHPATSFERENPDILMCQNEVTEVLKNM